MWQCVERVATVRAGMAVKPLFWSGGIQGDKTYTLSVRYHVCGW